MQDPEFERSLAERDADDRRREALKLIAEWYADHHCTSDPRALAEWLVRTGTEAFNYVRLAATETPERCGELAELVEAGYWLWLYDRKLAELEDADG